MHLPFAKALKSAPHSPFANSLQRIGKHTAFAICNFDSAKWQGTAFAYGE
jgi:hypothetical protein